MYIYLISRWPTLVDEGVGVVLEAQALLEGAHALHDAEQVVVAPEEHVQAHLDVVAVLVNPRPHLAAHEAPRLVDLHLQGQTENRIIIFWMLYGQKR